MLFCDERVSVAKAPIGGKIIDGLVVEPLAGVVSSMGGGGHGVYWVESEGKRLRGHLGDLSPAQSLRWMVTGSQ